MALTYYFLKGSNLAYTMKGVTTNWCRLDGVTVNVVLKGILVIYLFYNRLYYCNMGR